MKGDKLLLLFSVRGLLGVYRLENLYILYSVPNAFVQLWCGAYVGTVVTHLGTCSISGFEYPKSQFTPIVLIFTSLSKM